MDLNPIHHLSAAKKWNAHILIMFNFWWLAGLVNGLKPHPPPLSTQKNEILIFILRSISDVGQTGQWTQTPSTTPLQPIKWNASFWIMFTSDDQPGWLMDSDPICHPSPANKMKCFFLDYVHFWWLARLVEGLKPHLPPLSSQKNEMLTFGLRSLWMISQAGQWTQTPSTTPLQPKKMKCSFLDYVQLLMISWAGRWTQTPSTTPLLPKKWNSHFWIMSNFSCWPDWSMDSNPIHHPSPANKMKCFFLDYVHFWWSARLVDGLRPHLPPLSSQ